MNITPSVHQADVCVVVHWEVLEEVSPGRDAGRDPREPDPELQQPAVAHRREASGLPPEALPAADGELSHGEMQASPCKPESWCATTLRTP